MTLLGTISRKDYRFIYNIPRDYTLSIVKIKYKYKK
jgi:hypothetical protein